ncbi:MAG: serine/threonine protein kinase [Deltaproteobacteria bacterium]|nr:serine/threonine protein kinase [Deltaproteobacteria bacterium]
MDENDPAQGLVGRVLHGRFAVWDVLARGGMGVLYAGRDTQLDRAVVIKVVGPHALRSSAAGPRLVREAQLLRRVQHASIVAVHEVGLLETGEPFLVMERLEGRDLRRVLEEDGTLSPAQLAAILAPVADALSALHAANVLHRDLKPENLFLLEGRVERPRVKILDFGLAMLDERSAERFTRSGQIVGTHDYVAPECVRGERASAASDVYALATTAFELLTGHLPFEGRGLDLLLAKASEAPTDLAAFLPSASPALCEVFVAALAPDPSRRPTAVQLVQTLARAASDDVLQARGDASLDTAGHAVDGASMPPSSARR